MNETKMLFSQPEMAEEPNFRPPQELTAEMRKWCEGIIATFDLKAHHLKLLQAAAESWDYYQAAREFLVKHGTTYCDRFGQPCSRPEVAIARDSKTSFIRILRELNLPGDAGPGGEGVSE